jgi:hypothetical protein
MLHALKAARLILRRPTGGIVMKNVFVVGILCALLLSSCSGNSDLVIVSKTVRSGANTSAAVPDEFASAAPSTSELYWIEGQIKNSGTTEVRNVAITFRATDGNTRRLFLAVVERIPPGATVKFETERYPSPLQIKLVDEEPEVKVGK